VDGEIRRPVGQAGAGDDHGLLELTIELGGKLVVDERAVGESGRAELSRVGALRVEAVKNPEKLQDLGLATVGGYGSGHASEDGLVIPRGRLRRSVVDFGACWTFNLAEADLVDRMPHVATVGGGRFEVVRVHSAVDGRVEIDVAVAHGELEVEVGRLGLDGGGVRGARLGCRRWSS